MFSLEGERDGCTGHGERSGFLPVSCRDITTWVEKEQLCFFLNIDHFPGGC